MGYIIVALFFAVPVIADIGWILNIIKYCQIKKEYKLNPCSENKEMLKAVKSNLIISSVIVLVLSAVIIGLVVLFSAGIAYM